jgi:aminoglycoside 6'-N-acetyltransferase
MDRRAGRQHEDQADLRAAGHTRLIAPADSAAPALELRGERVVLRPLRTDEIDAVLAGRRLLDDSAHMTGARARQRLRTRVKNSGRLVAGRLDLAIEVDGRLVGEIDARAPRSFVPPGVFELGIGLFAPADRGRGHGADAIRTLVEHLFESEQAVRVQAGTRVDNVPMRRVFERLGFVEEGVMRDFLPAADGRADCVLYAVTRAERERVRA